MNPLMHSWHRVIIRYCDGTAFLGSLDAPLYVNGTTLYFRGRDNIFAVVDALLGKHGLANASEVVVSGCSAGGIAAVLLADHLRQHLATRLRKPALVTALSDSGVFVEWPGPPPHGLLSFPQFEWIYSRANASASVPRGCLEAGLSSRCMHIGVALPYVSTPVFILQSAADSWQVHDPSAAEGSLRALAEQMRRVLSEAVRGAHGAVVDSCFHHCEAWGQISWGGQSNAAAFQKWYESRREEWLAGQTGTSAVAEGWPLMHVVEPWIEGCTAFQAQHWEWHRKLPRE